MHYKIKQIEYTRLNSRYYHSLLNKSKDMIKMGKVSDELSLKQTAITL